MEKSKITFAFLKNFLETKVLEKELIPYDFYFWLFNKEHFTEEEIIGHSYRDNSEKIKNLSPLERFEFNAFRVNLQTCENLINLRFFTLEKFIEVLCSENRFPKYYR